MDYKLFVNNEEAFLFIKGIQKEKAPHFAGLFG